MVHVQAPKACENFLALCASGQYDETIFHRNIRGFMVQGGDPTGSFWTFLSQIEAVYLQGLL